MQAWVSSLIHNIHTHKFSRPICTGFDWEMLPRKIAKHFPLGNYFINFHTFFSWLCKGRPGDSKTVLYSKFHIRGFWIPSTGFRIPIDSGHDMLTMFWAKSKNHLATSKRETDRKILTASTGCCSLFDTVTASGRMSEQYVYNRSFCGILNNGFNQ